MAVVLRLARHGSKKNPFYRIVVTDSRNTRDGRFIENVGSYDPLPEQEIVEFNHDRVEYWLSQGATPSQTVKELLKRHPRGAAAAPAKKKAPPKPSAVFEPKIPPPPEEPKEEKKAAAEETPEAAEAAKPEEAVAQEAPAAEPEKDAQPAAEEEKKEE